MSVPKTIFFDKKTSIDSRNSTIASSVDSFDKNPVYSKTSQFCDKILQSSSIFGFSKTFRKTGRKDIGL